MTAPRAVFNDSTYMLVRRTSHRHFLLAPKVNNRAWEYCLAWAAKKTGVKLLWTVAMSNHHHTGIHDPNGNISAFCREFHRLIAKHHNASYGRFENLWASGEATLVRLEDRDAILDKLVYSLANPTAADLVDRIEHWPGIATKPADLCTSKMVKRPKKYFRKNGPMPAELELELHRPPGFEDMTDTEFRELVAARLREAESSSRERRRVEGRKVVGRRRIRAQSWRESPTSWAKRFGMKPRVATRDKWKRIAALQRLKTFVADHRDALQEWRDGNRDVCFPYGTNAMRIVHGVRCAPPPG